MVIFDHSGDSSVKKRIAELSERLLQDWKWSRRWPTKEEMRGRRREITKRRESISSIGENEWLNGWRNIEGKLRLKIIPRTKEILKETRNRGTRWSFEFFLLLEDRNTPRCVHVIRDSLECLQRYDLGLVPRSFPMGGVHRRDGVPMECVRTVAREKKW